MPKLSTRSTKALIGVHRDLVKVITEAIKDTPVDFTVVYGVRTAAEQNAIYKANPKATTKDGYIRKSKHQTGHAVDIYPYYNGKVQVGAGLTKTEATILNLKQQELADHVQITANKLGVKIIRGIDWKNPYDPPHFELA